MKNFDQKVNLDNKYLENLPDKKLFDLNQNFAQMLNNPDEKKNRVLENELKELAEKDEAVKQGMTDMFFEELRSAFKLKEDERFRRIMALRNRIFAPKTVAEDKPLTDKISQVMDEGEYDYAAELARGIELIGQEKKDDHEELSDELEKEREIDLAEPELPPVVPEEGEKLWNEDQLIKIIIDTDNPKDRRRAIDLLYLVILKSPKRKDFDFPIVTNYRTDKLHSLIQKETVSRGVFPSKVMGDLYFKLLAEDERSAKLSEFKIKIKKKWYDKQQKRMLIDHVGRRKDKEFKALENQINELHRYLEKGIKPVEIADWQKRVNHLRRQRLRLLEMWQNIDDNDVKKLHEILAELEPIDEKSENAFAADFDKIRQQLDLLEDPAASQKMSKAMVVRRSLHSIIDHYPTDVNGLAVIGRAVEYCYHQKKDFFMPAYLIVRTKYGFGMKRDANGELPAQFEKEQDILFDVLPVDKLASLLSFFYQEIPVREVIYQPENNRPPWHETSERDEEVDKLFFQYQQYYYAARRIEYLFNVIVDGNPGDPAHDKAVEVFQRMLWIEGGEAGAPLCHRPTSYLIFSELLSGMWTTNSQHDLTEVNDMLRKITGNQWVRAKRNENGTWWLMDYPQRGENFYIKENKKFGNMVKQGELSWSEAKRIGERKAVIN